MRVLEKSRGNFFIFDSKGKLESFNKELRSTSKFFGFIDVPVCAIIQRLNFFLIILTVYEEA